MKILAKADILHLNAYGRPISGDVLLVEQHGTTPKYAKDIVMATWGHDGNFYENNAPLMPKSEPDYDFLSGSDMGALNDAIAIYKDKDVTEVEAINHAEPFWAGVKESGDEEVPVVDLLENGVNNKFFDYLQTFGPSIVF